MGIDDVRDMFGADPSLGERLRDIAAGRLATGKSTRHHWFRPMLKRDPDTEVRLDRPLKGDLETMIAGGYIEPERMAVCWTVLGWWLEELAASHASVPWDPAMFDRIEWDLARAGLSSDYSLRRLADRSLGIPLRPAPGQVSGYSKAVHVGETASALRRALADPSISDETVAFVGPLQGVLETAVRQGLDIVIVGVTESLPGQPSA